VVTFSISIPALLKDKVSISDVYANYTQRGLISSYGVDLTFRELGETKTVKTSDQSLLPGKIEQCFGSWAQRYQRELARRHRDGQARDVSVMNEEASTALGALQGLLGHTLGVNDAVTWNDLKIHAEFSVDSSELLESSEPYLKFDTTGRPTKWVRIQTPEKPEFEAFARTQGWFTRLFLKTRLNERYAAAVAAWDTKVAEVARQNEGRRATFDVALAKYVSAKAAFEAERDGVNEAVEDTKARYLARDPQAIVEYCNLVLTSSLYPDLFPKKWDLEFRAGAEMMIVDYQLPALEQIPAVESYRYVKSRDEIVEKRLTDNAVKKLFDDVCFQICLRTIHELFEADVVDALGAVVFNGSVTAVSPATGRLETKTILSVSAPKKQFMEFDLAKVDPRAAFRHLKGVSAARLADLAAIAPIVRMDTTDKRFVDGREVIEGVQGTNLATMPWTDFEHLIRELFEKEFAGENAEVKVTRASADGGVDAVIFNPDPIRGGKIIIQAKRYSKTVGVSAVRDLYGTVMNEGATKGILVTTADYGRDSYDFVKDKPLTLLNGSNLLSLLDQHGHKARINIGKDRT